MGKRKRGINVPKRKGAYRALTVAGRGRGRKGEDVADGETKKKKSPPANAYLLRSREEKKRRKRRKARRSDAR